MNSEPASQAEKPPGLSLNSRILIGLGAGALVGLLLRTMGGDWVTVWLTDGAFRIVGQLFINGLQMLVVPLVLVSLITGVSALGDPSRLGRLGGKALLLYLLTTGIAVSLALLAGLVVRPGEGVELHTDTSFEAGSAPSLTEVIIQLVPKNPIAAMADGNMLPIIMFALLIGVAITLSGSSGQRTRSFFEDFNVVIMKLVTIVMYFAPYGVFALIARMSYSLGGDVFKNLAVYITLVLAVLLVQMLIVYPTLLMLLARLHPLQFLSKMRSAWLFAFSTASSNATIPVTMATLEKRIGVHNSVAAFTVPLGATINMDGTAIMQGIATAFIAQAYGIDLSIGQYITVILMVIMASIGAAGVPGVGIILLATVLRQVGLPVEGIAMILGVDRILDMARTAVNITGDAMVSTVVAKSENEMDIDTYNDPDAGAEE
ncbi:MAG: dicarboxylate/amino acid:cation symporter [Gammaproteobacteria bacterium]|jgi:Na+/H+-dicarboxylate symporter|nr:dicarboxylate/amino acid:cation symporter [Gammaproteobacteria bacterium]